MSTFLRNFDATNPGFLENAFAQRNRATNVDTSTFTLDIGSVTRLATSAPFAAYLTEEIYERSLMVQSGILALDSRLNGITGTRAEMPFFRHLNYDEEIVRSDNTWGDLGEGRYKAQRTTAATQYCPFMTRGAMFAMDDLSQVQTGEDALANIRSQLATDMNRKITAKIISQLTGLFGGPLAPNTLNIAAATTVVPGEANFLSAASITAGKYVLEERANELTTLVIHPLVAAHLEQVGMLTFSTPAGIQANANITWGGGGIGVTSTQIGYMAGLRVIVDSQVPVVQPAGAATGDALGYTCYLAGDGVIRTGSQFPLDIETDRNIASRQNNFTVTYNRGDHVLGTTWNPQAGVTDSPTNAQLATAANWGLAYTDTRIIPLVEMVVNTPFGGLVP